MNLSSKLRSFKQKYYRFLVLQGLLQFLAQSLIVLAFFIFITVYVSLNPAQKVWLSYGFYTLLLSSFIYWLGPVILAIAGLRNSLTNNKAAQLIGEHFSEIKDQLLNTLQLQSISDKSDLELAAVQQKLQHLEHFNFKLAINPSPLFKSFKYLGGAAALMVVFYIINPSLVKIGGEQIIRFGELRKENIPVQFHLDPGSLKGPKNERKDILVTIQEDIYIRENPAVIIDGKTIPLKQISESTFSFSLANPDSEVDFYFSKGNFYSDIFTFQPFDKPQITNYSISITPPDYTSIDSYQIKKFEDLYIPTGSKIEFNTECLNCLKKQLLFTQNKQQVDPNLNSFQSGPYTYQWLASNKEDSISTSIHTLFEITDKYPKIEVFQNKKESTPFQTEFYGSYSDDYGVSRLGYKLNDKLYTLEQTPEGTFQITVDQSDSVDTKIQFFVWDNDGIKGPKKSSSSLFTLEKVSQYDKGELRDELDKNLLEKVKDTETELKNIQKDMDQMRKSSLTKGEQNLNQKRNLQLLEKSAQVLNTEMEEIKELLKQLSKDNPSSKTEALEKRLKEMEKNPLLEEINKLQKELEGNKKIESEKLQELSDSFDLKKADLDRTLEMLKKLKVEQDIQNQIDKLKALAEKQKELAKTDKETGKEQDEINEKFNDLKEKLESIEKENEGLKDPLDFNAQEELSDQIKKNIEKISDQQDSPQKDQQQNDAGQQMDQMAEQMQQSLDSAQEEEQGENIETIRQILDNLITMSKGQELIQSSFQNADPGKPDYIAAGQEQRILSDNFKVIQDSLIALSERTPEISNTINEELLEIKQNIERTIHHIVELNKNGITEKQQYIITHTNNLALILDESLQNMKQQMQQKSKPGNGSCKKPGFSSGSKPSLSDVKKKQQELNRKMAEQQGQGKKKGKGKQGEKGGDGQKGMGGKEFMQLVKEQEQIRKMLQELQQEMNEDGSGRGNGLKPIIKDMEELEWNLLQKQLTQEMIQRQQRIESRLLESEKAERKREKDNKRESISGSKKMDNQINNTDKNKAKHKNTIKKNPIPVNQFYESIINQ